MKNPLSNAPAIAAGVLAFIAFLSIPACTVTNPSPQVKVPSAPPTSAKAAKNLSFFDGVVTPEIVFPNPAERALFEMLPPRTLENGGRAYVFPLIRQPGMDDGDLYLITVVWAPAGTFHPGLGGTGGPGGGIVDYAARTPDGLYDLRVSLGMQLPAVIDVPEFNFDSIVERLLQRYSRSLNTKPLKDK